MTYSICMRNRHFNAESYTELRRGLTPNERELLTRVFDEHNHTWSHDESMSQLFLFADPPTDAEEPLNPEYW